MQKRFFLGIAVILPFIFSVSEVLAITPDKYCNQLPAVSCEVLNVNFLTSSYGGSAQMNCLTQVKYCRNKKFKTISYAIIAPPGPPPYANYCAVKADGTYQLQDSNNTYMWNPTALETSVLCNALSTAGARPLLP